MKNIYKYECECGNFAESSIEMDIDCPICDSKMKVYEWIFEGSNLGKSSLESMDFVKCGFNIAGLGQFQNMANICRNAEIGFLATKKLIYGVDFSKNNESDKSAMATNTKDGIIEVNQLIEIEK